MSSIGFILPAHYCFSRGNGIREEALLKSRGLAELGHAVDLLTPWQAIERGSLDVVHFFYGGLPLANIAAVRQIQPRRLVFSTIIDSNQIQFCYRFAAWLGGITSRLHTVQGEFRRQCLIADAVVVRSQHERERVVRGLGIAEAKVHVVHLGIDLLGVDPLRSVGTDRDGVFHLSTFGQARKNVQRLIEAVGPTGLRLTIAGSCPPGDLPALQSAARPYPNVRILGFLTPDQRDDLYYRSRVFALPSLHEGTGLAALEAGARGCGVVITRNGGPPDYFTEVGHLVDPLSVTDIRARVLAAHADSSPVQIAGHVARSFNLRTCAERLVAVYRD